MSTMDYLTVTYAGASAVIISEAYTKMPASLSQLMETESISIWYSVPFALIQLLQHGLLEERNLESLRWVLYGGEPSHPSTSETHDLVAAGQIQQCLWAG